MQLKIKVNNLSSQLWLWLVTISCHSPDCSGVSWGRGRGRCCQCHSHWSQSAPAPWPSSHQAPPGRCWASGWRAEAPCGHCSWRGLSCLALAAEMSDHEITRDSGQCHTAPQHLRSDTGGHQKGRWTLSSIYIGLGFTNFVGTCDVCYYQI